MSEAYFFPRKKAEETVTPKNEVGDSQLRLWCLERAHGIKAEMQLMDSVSDIADQLQEFGIFLISKLRPEPSSPSAGQEPWYVTAYQFIRSAGWDEEYLASAEESYQHWLVKKLESLAALAPTQPQPSVDCLTPHKGMQVDGVTPTIQGRKREAEELARRIAEALYRRELIAGNTYSQYGPEVESIIRACLSANPRAKGETVSVSKSWESVVQDLELELAQARQQIEELKKFVMHGPECAYLHAWNPQNKKCDCGLEKALKVSRD